MFRNVQDCAGVFLNIVFFIFSSLWTKIADYTLNLSWGTEGSKSFPLVQEPLHHQQHLLHL